MRPCIVLPLHIYNYDPNGGLEIKDKKSMYEYSILQTSLAWPNIHIIVIAHGVYQQFFNKKPPKNISIYWSKKFQMPNEFGLFEDDPAQRSIVYEGLLIAKKLGYNYILKGRADSAFLNSKEIMQKISSTKKLILTQQTSFSTPYLIGDVFMFGTIGIMLKIWSPSEHYHKDGLRYFAKKIIKVFNMGFNEVILNHIEFMDLSSIGAVDYRFTWKSKREWLKKNHLVIDKIRWGAHNRWVKYQKNKIVGFDKPNLMTEKIFYSRAFRILARVPLALELFSVYKLLRRLFLRSELYKA